jgi:hypothetical protein
MMSRTRISSISRTPIPSRLVRATLALAALVLAAAAYPIGEAAAQSRAAAGRAGADLPRTAFGHPDLQGNWTNATLTPFQRPRGQGPVLTAAEVVAIESGQAEVVAERAEALDPDRPLPPGGDHPVCIDGATTCYDEAYRAPGDRVAVVDGEPRSSLVTHPADGRVPALTAEARRRIEVFNAGRASFGEYDHPELRPLAERCMVSFGSSAGPPMLPNYWYNNNYTIVQTPDHVMIMAEMVHDVRIIRLDSDGSLPGDVTPWFGDSRGHWEGDTLVVETTNLNPEHWFQGAPPSESRKVVERFTRVDEDTILYEFTIDDPTVYTSAWGGQVPFERLDDRLYEYACHEGNYAIANVLSGARYEEGRAAARR